MSDLNDFFAKKASKNKKKAALNVNTLGEKLERSIQAQLQEQREQKDRNASQTVQASGSQAAPADSEWIDPSADNLATNLEQLGIKDMAVADLNAEEISEEEEEETVRTKTWNTDAKPEEVTEEPMAAPPAANLAPAKYVPPSRGKYVPRRGAPVKLDLQNDEMFPTLAKADEVEKAKHDDAKVAKNPDWKVQGSTNRWGSDRPSAAPTSQQPAKPFNPNAYRPPAARGITNFIPAPRPTIPQVEKQPTANRYVPPNKRV
uniref:Translation initiation factor IF-2 n=1 Tax=Panagrellus redivivus TaxID=6233 RepID=A0A7E4ZYB8_PANRE